MTGPVFVDSNVLVHARDASEPEKQPRAHEWMVHLWQTRTGRLSYQVLQEFYTTVTDKLDPGLDRETARSEVLSFLAWRPVAVDRRVIEIAWAIQDRHQLSWWDALIVAAAQVLRCSHLLTEDLQDGLEIGDLRVVNPFLCSPSSLESG
jgi:predicted nucleic acid-binding protein